MALMKKVWAVAWIVLLFGALHVNGEEDNPCRHPEDRREGDGITGEITILATQTVKLEGQCGSSVDICSIAKGAVNYNDTVRQKWKCGVCGDRLASTRPADHDVTKSASHYPGGGDGPVTGAGTYRVSVSAGCSCCGKSDSTIVTVVIEHTFDNTDNCDVSLLWYNDPSTDPKKPKPNASPNCPYPESQAKMQNLCYQTGRCKILRVCTVCGEEDRSGSDKIENSKSVRTTKKNCEYILTQTVGCKHTKNTKNFTIVVQHDGETLGIGSRERSCNYVGAPGEYSVQEKNITIPVGATKKFNVAFAEKILGDHKYTEYKCRRCNLDTEFETPLQVSHSPEAELPPSPGSGELVDPQPPIPYDIRFDSSGDTKVTFKYLCESKSYDEITHEGKTFYDVTVPGCSDGKAGEYEFNVKVMTVGSLTVTSGYETGAGSSEDLPELDENDPQPSMHYYVGAYKEETADKPAEWETILLAEPTPSGEWPDGKPTWKRYPKVSGIDPIFTVDSDNPGQAIVHPDVGTYVFVARCEAAGETSSAFAKSLALHVVNPETGVVFSSPQLKENEQGEKYMSCSPCSLPLPVKLELTAAPNGIPDGVQAKVTFESPDNPRGEVFEVYKDAACTEKVDPGSLSWIVDSEQDAEGRYLNRSRTYYVCVLGPVSDELVTEFKVKMEYGIGEKLVSESSDFFKVIWESCSTGTCSAGGDLNVSMDSNGLHIGFSFGPGSHGESGGAFQMLTDFDRIYNPKITVAAAGDTKTALNSSGEVIRVMTGRFQTELSRDYFSWGMPGYPIGGSGGGVTSMAPECLTVKMYLSDNMNPAVAATGTPVFEVRYMGKGKPENSGKLEVIRRINGKTTRRIYSYTDLGYGAPYGFTGWFRRRMLDGDELAVEDYTENGIEYRRELRIQRDFIRTTQTIKRKFPWGYDVVKEIEEEGTRTYEYYDSSWLKKVTHPNGESVSYTYDDQGRQLSVSNFRGGQTTVTSYAYSRDAETGGQITDSTVTVGTTVISRSRNISFTYPGEHPEVSIRYDENNGELATRTWYVSDRTSPFYHRISRQVRPDGTEIRNTYVRGASGDTVTAESGVFDSSGVLLLGTRTVTVSNLDGVTVSETTYAVQAANNLTVKTAEMTNTAFDDFGRPTATQYLDGSTTSCVYGCCGVESETDRDGVETVYAYDEQTQKLSYSIRDGITTLYTYNRAGQQTAVTVKGRNGGEITTEMVYSGEFLAATVDELGNRTTNTRSYSNGTTTETTTNPDGSTRISTYQTGELTGISGTAVYPQSYEYGPNWQKTLPQNQTVYTDLLGRQYKTVYADGSEETQFYNTMSQLVKSVTPAGRVMLYEYDLLGRQTVQAVDMNGNGEIDDADIVTETAYGYAQESGKTVSVTTVTRRQGNDSKIISVRKESIDGLDSWETDASGLTTHTALERLGGGMTRQTVTNPDGGSVVVNMSAGRTTSVRNFNSDGTAGNVTDYAYDEFNRMIGVTEKYGEIAVNAMSMTYDAAGQILSQTVNGRTTAYAYDVANRTKTTTLPGGRVIVEEYFPTGELKKISGADTYTQEWTYDPVWGQKATLTTYKDASTPQVTGWTYNNRGFNVAKSYPDGTGPSYSYDADGKLLTRTWARGVVATYTYDAAGRAVGVSYSDETPAIAVTYDYLNRPVTVTDAAGTRNLAYNAQSQLVNETIPGIVNLGNSYSYDAFGRRTLRQLNLNNSVLVSESRTYDTQGRVATFGNGADTLSYTYRPGLNQLSGFTTAGTSTARTFEYDAQHRLTEIKLNGQLSTGYTLNEKDQRIRVESEDGSYWKFTYDGKSQVTAMERRRAGEEEQVTPGLYYGGFSYDDIGNWTETSRTGTTYYNLTSNILNQYTDVSTVWPMATWNPTYDADGNMLTGIMGWSYGWNGENRLISAENGDTRLEFSYDYMGRRFEKKVYTANVLTKHEKFVYDGYKLIQVLDALNSDAVTMAFAWHPESTGLDTPFSMMYDGETYYYVTDGNKNVMSLIDAAGTKVAEYVYDPFGRLLSSTGEFAEINPFRFSSEYHDDETGLVYYNYRYYSPELGRWISRDPIEEEGGVNLYAMVGNNPVNRWDHLGFSFWNEFWNIYERMEYEKVKRRVEELYLWFKDDEGYLIFERWALGKGDWLNAPFGDYLKKSIDLQAEMRERLAKKIDEVNKLVPPGEYVTVFKEDSFVLSDNRYRTGYELLHGTNWTVGGFRWYGQLYKKSPICFEGDINYEWNDIIDPNYDYDFDFIDVPLRVYLGFVPRNYTIKIKFSGKFQAAYYANRESWSFTGEFPAIQRER